METAPASPLPPTKHDFYVALRQTTLNRKIRREAWPAGEYVFLDEGFLRVFKDGQKHNLIIGTGDLDAEDWVVIL